jgi:hypothetical protein
MSARTLHRDGATSGRRYIWTALHRNGYGGWWFRLSNIEEIGLELNQRAVQVEMAGAQLVRAAAEAIWTSIAADAFRTRVDHRRHQFGAVADLLRGAAQSVFRYSDDVEAEQARLRKLEVAAEHAMIRGAVDVGLVVIGGVHL